jgi:hypothetical protein
MADSLSGHGLSPCHTAYRQRRVGMAQLTVKVRFEAKVEVSSPEAARVR